MMDVDDEGRPFTNYGDAEAYRVNKGRQYMRDVKMIRNARSLHDREQTLLEHFRAERKERAAIFRIERFLSGGKS